MGELPILWEDAIFAQKLIKQWIRAVLPLHSRPAIPATLVVGVWRADEAAARLWAEARLELAQSPGCGDTRRDTTALLAEESHPLLRAGATAHTENGHSVRCAPQSVPAGAGYWPTFTP